MSEIGDEFNSNSTEDFGFKSLGESIQLVTDYEEKLPFRHINNLSYATHKGIFAAAGKDKIVLGSLSDLKTDIENSDEVFKTNRQEIEIANAIGISFTRDETKLIISTGDSLKVASIDDYQKVSSTDFISIGFESSIDNFIPSPTNASKVAVLTTTGELIILDLLTQSKETIATDLLNFSWSPKGKQIVIALKDGSIKQITLSGEVKVIIPRPDDITDENLPLSVVWLSPFRFFVIYGEPIKEDEEDPSYDFRAFIISHDKSTNQNCFQENYDVIPAFGTILRKPTVYPSTFHNLSNSLPILTIVASSTSVEISGISESELVVPELDTARAALPINDDTGNDINAIGLITDINTTGKIEEPCQGVSEANWLPSVWVLGSDGKVQGWYIYHVHDLKNGSFKQNGVKQYDDELYKIALDGTGAGSAHATPAKSAEASKDNPFNFGGDHKTAFGSSTFGSSTESKPAFGSSTFGSSTFGSSTESKPAFGSSTFGSSTFGSTESKPAFGKSTFGSEDNKSTFGSTAFGSTNSKPAFGSSTVDSTESKPAFGSSGFGSTDKPASGSSTFGSSTFGSTDNKPGFGSTAFGSSTETKPAFGSSSFALTESKPAFGSTTFGSTDSKPAFGSSGFGSSGFGQTDSSDSRFKSLGQKTDSALSAFGSSRFGSSGFGQAASTDSPFAKFGQKNETETKTESPFASFGNSDTKRESSFASFGNYKAKPESPFKSVCKNETSSIFGASSGQSKSVFGSEQPKETPASSLFGDSTAEKPPCSFGGYDQNEPNTFSSMTDHIGAPLFGSKATPELSKIKVPGLSDDEDEKLGNSDSDNDSEAESEKGEISATPDKSTASQPVAACPSGPTTFGNVSFGNTSTGTAFGSSGFGSTGFGSSAFGSTGFKFGQQPPTPAESFLKKEKKVGAPQFGGFGQFASENKLLDLTKSKNVFDSAPSSTSPFSFGGKKDQEKGTQNEPSPAPKEQESFKESQAEEEPEDSKTLEDYDDDSREQYSESEADQTKAIDDLPQLDDGEEWSDDEVNEDDEKENDEEEQQDKSKYDETAQDEADRLGDEIDKALNLSEAGDDGLAEELGDDIDRNLNIDDDEEEEQPENDFENEDSKDTSSFDSLRDNEDEELYNEARFLGADDSETKYRKRSTQADIKTADASSEAFVSTKDASTSAAIETKEISIQTEPSKTVSIALKTFEDEEVYFGSFHVPPEVPNYVQLGEVKYPKLSSDASFSQLEKNYYDTQAEISIIEDNCTKIGRFLDEHLRTEPVHTEESLKHSHHWRLSEASSFHKILEFKSKDASDLKSLAKSDFDRVKAVQHSIDTLEKQAISTREKVIALEKLSDKAILNARDLPIEAMILQDKIRKSFAHVSSELRTSEKKIMFLKTASNVYYNEVPTPAVLHNVVNHVNSLSRNYATETKELSEQIAKLNSNHAKIVEALNEGKKTSFQESEWEHRSLTKLKVADLSKRLNTKAAINEALRKRSLSSVTFNFKG